MIDSRIFWTFQRAELLSEFMTSGVLIPDFASIKNTTREHMLGAYNHILNDYNTQNNSAYSGLIFGHCGSTYMSQINTINDLYELLDRNGYPSGTCYDPPEYLLLKLIIPDDVSIMKIDFYRFADLISVYDNEVNECQKDMIIKSLYSPNGVGNRWELIQGHIPYIKSEWIEAIYTPYKK